MLVIVGLIVLLVAGIVAIVGVLSNTGAAHPLTENFSVFGYHLTGSTGTFLFGMVVGAVALLGLSVLVAGARRTAGRGRDARHEVARFQREWRSSTETATPGTTTATPGSNTNNSNTNNSSTQPRPQR